MKVCRRLCCWLEDHTLRVSGLMDGVKFSEEAANADEGFTDIFCLYQPKWNDKESYLQMIYFVLLKLVSIGNKCLQRPIS